MKLSADVATLRERLTEYLGHVKAGNEVVVTVGGLPVARLTALEPGEQAPSRSRTPISTASTESLFLEPTAQGAGRRDRLARAGALKPGRGSLRAELLAPPAGERFGDRILAALLADRSGER